MHESKVHLIKDIKPFSNNLVLQCLIVKYIDDPPDKINNIVKYHYLVADNSGSIILCIPHIFIQEELQRNGIHSTVDEDVEDALDIYNSRGFGKNIDFDLLDNDLQEDMSLNEKNKMYDLTNLSRGISCEHVNNNKSNSTTQVTKHGTNTVPNSTNDTLRNNKNKLKYYFQIGDILHIYGAVTTWSMGKMVIIPNMREKRNSPNEKASIHKVGFFNMEISLEPNVSNLITSTVENKYRGEENRMNKNKTIEGVSEVTQPVGFLWEEDFINNRKTSKYDIIPLIHEDLSHNFEKKRN